MGWTILALRRLRSDLAPTLGVLVLVLVTALIAALAPRVLASLANGAIHGAIDAAPVAARNIALLETGIAFPGPVDDPLEQVRSSGEERLGTFPIRVQDLVQRTDALVETARFKLTKPTTDPAFLRLRIQDGIDDHIRYVEGRKPTAAVETRSDVGPEHLDEVPVYEGAVAAETARRFGLAV